MKLPKLKVWAWKHKIFVDKDGSLKVAVWFNEPMNFEDIVDYVTDQGCNF